MEDMYTEKDASGFYDAEFEEAVRAIKDGDDGNIKPPELAL